jgi:hypothetical protein
VVLYACQPCHVSDTIGVDGHNATLFASVHLASTEANIGVSDIPDLCSSIRSPSLILVCRNARYHSRFALAT